MEPHVKHQIVKTLICDDILVTKWNQLVNSLKLQAEFVQLIQSSRKESTTDYEFFSKILTQWVSAKGNNATVDELCTILEKEGFQNAANKLQTFMCSTNTNIKDLHWFQIDRPAKNFVGREEEMDKLVEFFASPTKFHLCIIIGMGGVGKSELAKNFAKRIFSDKKGHCIWLNGKSPRSFQKSVNKLADSLNVEIEKPENSKSIPRAIDEIFMGCVAVLRENCMMRTLLIIDNVDKKNEDVKSFLATINQIHIFALVTSRNSAALDYPASEVVIRLEVLPREMSTKFIKNHFPEELDRNVNSLCNILQDFPLALQQAVAFIKMQRKGQSYGIQNFLDNYEEERTELTELLEFKLNSRDNKYRLTTLATWNASFNQIKTNKIFGDLALELLNYMAYFEPANIEIKFLYKIYTSVSTTSQKSNTQVNSAVKLIKEYSLIKVEDGNISIHRLVQEVIRVKLIAREMEYQFLRSILQAVDRIYLRRCVNSVDTMGDFEINDHIVSAMRLAVNHDDLIRAFPHLPYEILQRIFNQGERLKFAKLIERRMIEVLCPNHLQTLRMGIQVGRAMVFIGALGGVKKLSETFQRLLILFGEDSTTKSEQILGNLQKSLIDQNEVDESVALLELLYKSYMKIWTEERSWWAERLLQSLGEGYCGEDKKTDQMRATRRRRLSVTPYKLEDTPKGLLRLYEHHPNEHTIRTNNACEGQTFN